MSCGIIVILIAINSHIKINDNDNENNAQNKDNKEYLKKSRVHVNDHS